MHNVIEHQWRMFLLSEGVTNKLQEFQLQKAFYAGVFAAAHSFKNPSVEKDQLRAEILGAMFLMDSSEKVLPN